MPHRSNQGLTAIELMVVIVVIGIAAAVTVPAILRGSRNDLLIRCESNLRALWKADADARAAGGPAPEGRGRAYWASLVPPERLVCPLSGHAHYRGPKEDPSPLPPLAPIAADAPDSHGTRQGGFVLLKNGELRAAREGDRAWKEAAELLGP